AQLDAVALLDQQASSARQRVADLVELLAVLALLVGDDGDLHAAVGLLDVDEAGHLGQLRGTLRVPRLDDLDDARDAVGDVAGAAAAPRVDRPHRGLRPGLPYRRRGDDPARVADLGQLAGPEEDPVAVTAHAVVAPALEHRPNRKRRLLGLVAELVDDLLEE